MHHRPAALGRHDQGFYRSLPLLEILLGLGKLLDMLSSVFEGDELATAGQGNGVVARDQSAMMQPGRANVGAAVVAHCAEHPGL